MPKGPAARMGDNVTPPHIPPAMAPGPGSTNVMIGKMPAWRGVPAADTATLQGPKQTADAAIQAAVATTAAAVGPAIPAAYAAEQALKTSMAAMMAGLIQAACASAMASAAVHGGSPDTYLCTFPSPIPPHGPGVVINGSATVLINGLPACRQGDTILEAIGPPNSILMGCPTVIIGG